MALNTLAFPTDIQWRRLCVSSDMLVREVCDRDFPPRWRSSIAVFSYEPPEDQQTYPDHLVSYLKVSCSITGIQPGAEVGMDDPDAIADFNDSKVIEEFASVVDRYYPCYGAVLEVAVKPNLEGEGLEHVPLKSFPYFIDFEPKKREIIEVVTDTGERMSRSESAVNVRKGTTTTEGHEVVDTDTWGVNAGVSAGAVSLGGLYANTSSTKDMTGSQHENIRTTDHGRELRESYSHQTQLTQMYQQFTAYHVGTNRAVFFMLPRPHILDREHTFVNGPRQLEGLQDVLLVMMRPKTTQTVCVEAYLETAHLAFAENVYEKRLETKELNIKESRIEGPSREYTLQFDMPAGYELDTSEGDGYYFGPLGTTSPNQPDNPVMSTRIVSQDMDQIVFGATIHASAQSASGGYGGGLIIYYYSASLVLTVHLRRTGEEPQDVPQDLYLTGRGVCCCEGVTVQQEPPGGAEMGEVTHEMAPSSPVPQDTDPQYATVALLAEQIVPTTYEFHLTKQSGMRVVTANRLRTYIGEWLMRTMSSPQRYPRGKMSFLDSQFLGRRMAKALGAVGHVDNIAARELNGLSADLVDAVATTMPAMRRADLLRMPLAELRQRLEVSHEQAVTLRRAALGLLTPAEPSRRRWTAPDRPTVPDLLGMDVHEAGAALSRLGLVLGAVTERDSEQPPHTVLEQRPAVGVVVTAGTTVDLTVASGLTVRVPDIVGRGIGEALRLLHEAGLRSEPELLFTRGHGQRKHTVLEVEPRQRTYVTPHARVVLHVVEGH